jgi:hypothetical protein
MGLIELGFAPGETVSILGNTRQEWLFCDLGALCAGGISSGIYPTDAAEPGRIPDARIRARSTFRRGRGAARQGAGSARRLPLLRKIVVWDMEGLRELDDPQVISLERLRELGRERIGPAWPPRRRCRMAGAHRQRASPQTWPSSSTPRAPPASPRGQCSRTTTCYSCAASTSSSRRTKTTSTCASCRCATSPSAWQRRLFLAVHRRRAQFRREPGDHSRERARDPADGVPRRAAHLGEVLFRRDASAGRGHRMPREAGLQMGHRRRPGNGAPLREGPAHRLRPQGACTGWAGCWCSTTCAS